MTTGEEGERGRIFYIWREGGSVRSKWAALSKKALKLQPIYIFFILLVLEVGSGRVVYIFSAYSTS